MQKVAIKYVPHPHVRPFHAERAKYFIRALVTGYGGGKTYAGCMEMIQVSGVNKGVPNIYIEPTNQMVKDILEPEMINIIERNKIPYHWNKTDHNFYFPMWNGHVWLRSGDKPEKMKGINAGVLGIDEPFIQDEEIYKIAVSRARHPLARVKGIFLTGTPEQLNWGYDLLFDNENMGKTVQLYQGSTIDNQKYLGEAYIQQLMSAYSDKEVEAYVYGKFINLQSGLLYYAFSDRNVIEHYHYKPNLPLDIYCDFNVDIMCWSIGQEFNNKDYVFDNITITGEANTQRMCELIKEKKFQGRKHEGLFRFYVDMAGTQRSVSASESSIAIIKRNFPNAKVHYKRIKNVKDRIDATNGRFLNYNKQINLFIVKDQRTLIKDLRKSTWDMLLHRVKVGRYTHPSDGLTYGMNFKHPIKRKISVYQHVDEGDDDE